MGEGRETDRCGRWEWQVGQLRWEMQVNWIKVVTVGAERGRG